MNDVTNRRVILAAHPVGFPQNTDFELIESSVPEPSDGEVLLKTLYLLSLIHI